VGHEEVQETAKAKEEGQAVVEKGGFEAAEYLLSLDSLDAFSG